MPIAGAKPKADRTQIRHRVPPAHDWIEVEDVPFAGAPALPDRDRPSGDVLPDGAPFVPTGLWPESTKRWYASVSVMPHAKLWTPSDWEFVFTSAEIHARGAEGWRGYSGAEMRQRDKALGTFADARRDLRIRYVPVKQESDNTPANVSQLDDYRNL